MVNALPVEPCSVPSIPGQSDAAQLGPVLAVRALEHAQHRNTCWMTSSMIMSPNQLINLARQEVLGTPHLGRFRATQPSMGTSVHQEHLIWNDVAVAENTCAGHAGPCHTAWEYVSRSAKSNCRHNLHNSEHECFDTGTRSTN